MYCRVPNSEVYDEFKPRIIISVSPVTTYYLLAVEFHLKGSVYCDHRIIDERMEKYCSVFVFISK